MNFHVIKENDLFLVTNQGGEIPDPQSDAFGYGLFTKDTRILSRFTFAVDPQAFVLLDGDSAKNYEATYRYTNREWKGQGEESGALAREVAFLTRRQFVDGKRFYEEGSVQNYGFEPVTLRIRYVIAADFSDMFEVRGYQLGREKPSTQYERQDCGFLLRRACADGLFNRTAIRLYVEDRRSRWHVAEKMEGGIHDGVVAYCDIVAPAHERVRWLIFAEADIAAVEQGASLYSADFQNVLVEMEHARATVAFGYQKWMSNAPQVHLRNDFAQWYERGLLDIRMLLTDVGYGMFPVAGVPWYAVPFGRDSIIAALQLLPVHKEVAKGTLLTMAAYQGSQIDASRDEQPGKIMHELRAGELTRMGVVPFGPYYGTIDATPLFLALASEYFAWTGDLELVRSLLPAVEKAFAWIEQYGDRDGDGFVEYCQESNKGIANQGWKDSGDCMVHKDGCLATAPIALCEVQGYVYKAYSDWARIYTRLQLDERAAHCSTQAQALRAKFIRAYWVDADQSLALALDGDKRQVASVSSNMGQVLWSGILEPVYAERLMKRVMAPDLYNGYGIRTLSANEVAYNPLSYHNGTVWPHDTSLIMAGLQRYGNTEAAATVVEGLLQAAKHFPLMRLPELFLGFGAKDVPAPVPYPVSCSPQAWASGAPMLALQCILGLRPQVDEGLVYLHPTLPQSMEQLDIRGLRLGEGELSVLLTREKEGATGCAVLTNSTGLRVVMESLYADETIGR